MALLALYPVLGFYGTSFGIELGQMTLFMGLLLVFFKRGLVLNKIDGHYIAYWAYIAIIYILLADKVKVSLLIPGGVAFFVWSVLLWLLAPYFDFQIFKKYLRIVACISIVVFLLQELLFMLYSFRFSALLPISDRFYGQLSYVDMVLHQQSARRSSSLFLEPAYFADFLLLSLTIEIFSNKIKNRICKVIIFLHIIVIFWLASGSGLFGLLVIILLWLIKGRTKKSKLLTWFIISLPFLVYALYWYSQTAIGTEVISRQSELSQQDTSGYARIFRGYDVYVTLPLINQIFGSPFSLLASHAASIGIDIEQGAWTFNGFQQVLMLYGIIGISLLIWFYKKQYTSGDTLSQVFIWLLLYLSMIEYIYLAPIMFIITLFLISRKFHGVIKK